MAPALAPSGTQELAPPEIPPPSLWRPVVVAVAAALLVAAFVVHAAVIPLEVLFTWGRPVALYVATEPEGAAVTVDGLPLGEPAPTKIEVRRDRADHVVEASLPGHRPAREVVRYDRSWVLSFVLRLQPDPTAPPAGDPGSAARKK
jgi:hypothetical protein